MKNGIRYIVGAGENYGLDFTPLADDYVIAVDGGFSYLQDADIAADLVIGDFDSLEQRPEHSNVVTLPREKDETDTLAAIQYGIEKGYRIFHIYCGMGGRFDHSIAKIQALSYLSQMGLQGLLFGKDSVLTAITDGKITFPHDAKGYISVFSMTDKSIGVDIKGLKYELENAELTNHFPVGVSNEFTGSKSSISVSDGTLLIVYPIGTKFP